MKFKWICRKQIKFPPSQGRNPQQAQCGFPEPCASEFEMFSKSREFWGQWFVVSKLKWLNFQWTLHLLRLNAEVLTPSFSCILNKYGILSGDVHLNCKFHYENAKHVIECFSAFTLSVTLSPHPRIFNQEPVSSHSLHSISPTTDRFISLAQLLIGQPSSPNPLMAPSSLLYSVIITYFDPYGCPYSCRQAGLLLLVQLVLVTIFFCFNTVSIAIYPWPGRFKSCLPALWSDAFNCLCGTSYFPVSTVVTQQESSTLLRDPVDKTMSCLLWSLVLKVFIPCTHITHTHIHPNNKKVIKIKF